MQNVSNRNLIEFMRPDVIGKIELSRSRTKFGLLFLCLYSVNRENLIVKSGMQ